MRQGSRSEMLGAWPRNRGSPSGLEAALYA